MDELNNENEYYEKSVVNLKKEFNDREEKLLDILGIEIEDRLYTEAEFDKIDQEVFSFYQDNDDEVSDDEMISYEFPEDVSMKDYKKLIDKLEKIHNKYNV